MGVYFVLLNGLRVTILGNGAKKGLTNSNKDPDVTVSMLEVLLPSVMYSTEKNSLGGIFSDSDIKHKSYVWVIYFHQDIFHCLSMHISKEGFG